MPHPENHEPLFGFGVTAGDDANGDDLGREQAVDRVRIEPAQVRPDQRALGQPGAGHGQQFDDIHAAPNDHDVDRGVERGDHVRLPRGRAEGGQDRQPHECDGGRQALNDGRPLLAEALGAPPRTPTRSVALSSPRAVTTR